MSDTGSLLGARRYQILDLVGAGSMGAVYRAHDRLTGQTVALKRVALERGPDGGSPQPAGEQSPRLTLAHEFRTLASLRHPHIISVLDYGFDIAQEPFFTMELLAGAQSVIDAGAALSGAERVGLLLQALEALAYLHRRGVLHHDLKPANVLVAGGRARLLDFGLAVLAHQQRDDDTFGTLRYLAPEVLDGQPYTEAADLYSLGVIAYELLIGRHPFAAETAADFLDQVFERPPDLAPLAGDPPLAEAVATLLAKQPSGRYPSAEAAIAALRLALAQPAAREEPAIRESFLQAAAFVGRDRELALLSAALRDALGGSGSAWLVGGESGVGKSRLLDELRTRALVAGAMVLRGQAVDSSALPYQLWRSPLRRLVLAADPSDLDAGVLHEIIPDIGALLGRTIEPAPQLPGAAGRQRLDRTIADLLRRQTQPIVLLLEDLQWMGESQAPLLATLSAVESLPLLVVASYRNDERPGLPSELPQMRQISLARLERDAIGQLSAAMLGPAGRQAQVIELLARESEGNTFFMIEVVRALAEEAGGLSQVGSAALPPTIFAGGVRQALRRRIGRAPMAMRGLLEIAAVAGRELDLALLAHLSPQTRLEEWLTTCAAVAVLEVADGRWRFTHDKLREALLADLPIGIRPALHRAIARAIESIYPDQAIYTEALAEHWEQAGEIARAIEYLVRLATRMVRVTGEYARAAALVRRGLSFGDRARAATLLWLAGAAALRLGSYDDAVGHFAAAIDTDGAGADDLAAALNGLSRAYWEQGDDQRARRYAQDALAAARESGNLDQIGQSLQQLGAAAERLGDYEAARDAFEESLRVRRALGDHAAIAGSLNDLGTLAWYQGEYASGQSFYEEGLRIMRAIGHRLGVVVTLGNLGIMRSDQGEYRAASDALEEGLALARELADPFQIAWSLNNLGNLRYMQGALADASACFAEGLAAQRAIGNRPGIVDNLRGLGYVALADADLPSARARFEESLAIAAELGNDWLRTLSLNGLGHVAAAGGDAGAAHSYYATCLALAREGGDRQLVASAQTDIARVLLRQGRLPDARSALMAGARAACALYARPLHAHALLGMAEMAAHEGDYGAAAAHLALVRASHVLDPCHWAALARLTSEAEAALGAELAVAPRAEAGSLDAALARAADALDRAGEQ